MNGLNFIRTRCNISLSELADILDVSRQQISAWENGVKPICQKRLSQLSKYFGVDEKYFLEISEADKEFILSKGLYRRQDREKECYSFIKLGEIEEDYKYRSFLYPDFEKSLDGMLIEAKKKKKDTLDNIEYVMKYFGKTDKIIEEVGAINRGCKVYDLLTTYMNQMPNEAPGMSMVFYYMVRNVLFSLLISQDLMTREELDKEFTYDKGIPLYDDRSWICELAEIFKKKYDEKREISKEISIRIKEDNKKQNTN